MCSAYSADGGVLRTEFSYVSSSRDRVYSHVYPCGSYHPSVSTCYLTNSLGLSANEAPPLSAFLTAAIPSDRDLRTLTKTAAP